MHDYPIKRCYMSVKETTLSPNLSKLIVIAIVGFYITYILWIFPAILDYYYFGAIPYDNLLLTHHISNVRTNVAGSQLIIISLMLTSGLSHFTIICMPLLLIPLFLLIISIFKKFLNNYYSILLTISFLLPFASPDLFVAGIHELGFILYLSLILILIISYKNNKINFFYSIMILLIIIIICFISYKISALILLFILFLIISEIIKNKWCNDKFSIQSGYLFLIGLISAIGLNIYFYSTALPYLEEAEFGDLAFFKIARTDNSPLFDALYGPPDYLLSIGFFRHCLILLVLCSLSLILTHNLIRNKYLNQEEWVFLALLGSSCCLFFIYYILGSFQILYIKLVGCIGICLLYDSFRNKVKIIKPIIWLLFITGILYISLCINSGYYLGHKSTDEFHYLNPSADWLKNHIDGTKNLEIKSDVLTTGFMTKKFQSPDRTANIPLNMFTIDDVILIINGNHENKNKENNLFVLNNNINYISLPGWYFIKSLSNYDYKIQINDQINVLYSSGLVDIISSK